MTRIGVLAFQGDVSEHARMVTTVGAEPIDVRTPAALESVDGLIIPGGESPTIGKLMTRTGLDKAITARVRMGMPVYGTCAGMILLANEVSGGEPPLLKLLDIAVERNAYGRQRESFEAWINAPAIDPAQFRIAFIRAPIVTRVGSRVQVLASHEGHPVILQQDHLLVSSFHPELTRYAGVHRYFLTLVAGAAIRNREGQHA